MDEALNVADANVYAVAAPVTDPSYGPIFMMSGLLNDNNKLAAGGTYIAHAYDPLGSANKRPEGITVAAIDYEAPAPGILYGQDGAVTADLILEPGVSYPKDEHLPTILLVDADSLEAVYLDYRVQTSCDVDAAGNVSKIRLTIPSATEMPQRLKAYVILDVFPLCSRFLRE